MYEINKMTSLVEFDKYFCNIANAYWGGDTLRFDDSEELGKNLMRWEQVDDRFHSFYGSTYEVPLEPVPQIQDAIKIAIIGDKWLMSENILYRQPEYNRIMTELENRWTITPYYSLVKELRDIYPNAEIDVVGDYSNEAIELNTLDKVIDYVKVHKDIDYLVCNGVENTKDARKKMKFLDDFCLENDIKCCIVGTPHAKYKRVPRELPKLWDDIARKSSYCWTTVGSLVDSRLSSPVESDRKNRFAPTDENKEISAETMYLEDFVESDFGGFEYTPDVTQMNSPTVLQFFCGYLPTSRELYKDKNKTTILGTWADIVRAHAAHNIRSKKQLVALIGINKKLKEFLTMTQDEYEETMTAPPPYTDEDRSALDVLRINYKTGAGVAIEINDIILDMYPTIEEFRDKVISKKNPNLLSEQFSKDLSDRLLGLFKSHENVELQVEDEYFNAFNTDDYCSITFEVSDFLYRHLNIIKYNCFNGSSYTEDQIKREYGWLYATKIDEPISQKYFRNYVVKSDGKKWAAPYTTRYTEFIYNKIKRFVIENLFDIKKNSYYVSFNHYFVGRNKNNTIYAKYFGAWTAYTGRDGKTNETSYERSDIHGAWRYDSKYCNDGTSWNLFKNSGEIITVTVSLGFSEHIFSCEYFGANCYDEWMLGNDDTIQFCNLLKIREWCPPGGHEVQMINPPVFHNTGSPWFTISEENKHKYRSINEIKCPIEFIVRRDNTSASIIMHLDKTYTGEKEIFSAISFGRFEQSNRETNTRYSLYVAGGTTGLANDVYVYQPTGGGCLTYEEGNVYDLNIQNIAMSNSDIVNPTQFYNARWSNFKVLCEDSKWRSIYTLAQGAEVMPFPVCGGCSPTFSTRLLPPSNFTPDHMITKNPMSQKKRFFVNSKKKYNIIKREARRYNIQMDTISVVINGVDKAHYILGSIPNVYIHYDHLLPLGLIELDDGMYINLPCVWDERLYHYKVNLEVVNDEWEPLYIVEAYENKKMDEKRNKILYRTLIRLGDVPI